MRKLVLILACLAAAVPAVALAADENDTTVSGDTPSADERAFEARIKGKLVRNKIDRRAEKAEQARERKRAAKRQGGAAGAANGGATTPAHLQSIAACESGGNPRAIGGGGAYRGKYQFDHQTWASVGGSGDPAAAPEAEQDKRAAMLYARAGAAPWPVCGS
jgi:soluble lytic murein transglycosylase-like protein